MRLSNGLKAFVSDESGATSIEYALIAVIVSISIIGGLVSVQGALNGILSGAGQALFDAVAN